jgi:Ca2+-binding RTX toxin-like protein
MSTTYPKTVKGTAGDDSISYDNRRTDTLFLLGEGNDNLDLFEVSDSKVVMHTGDDTVYASNATRTQFFGGSGNDTIDVIYGEYVAIDGGSGNDTIGFSGTGSEYLRYSSLHGGTGDDTIRVIGQTNNVLGGDGNDALTISGYRNNADGGGGSDVVSLVGGGRNIARGGAGDDFIYNFNGGSFNSLFGDTGNDYIADNNGSNELRGGDGDDTIFAYGGSDFIVTGGGNDIAYGGKGNDVFHFNKFDALAGNDTIVDTEGANRFEFVLSDTEMDNFTFSFDAATQILKLASGATTSMSIETTAGFKNIEQISWEIDGFGTAKIDNNFTSAVAAAIQAYNASGELEYNNATNKVEVSVGGTIIATLPVA